MGFNFDEIGSNIILFIEECISWLESLSPDGLIGFAIVCFVALFFISIIIGLFRLLFYRWYMKGILHDKRRKEKDNG